MRVVLKQHFVCIPTKHQLVGRFAVFCVGCRDMQHSEPFSAIINNSNLEYFIVPYSVLLQLEKRLTFLSTHVKEVLLFQ